MPSRDRLCPAQTARMNRQTVTVSWRTGRAPLLMGHDQPVMAVLETGRLLGPVPALRRPPERIWRGPPRSASGRLFSSRFSCHLGQTLRLALHMGMDPQWYLAQQP